MATQGIAYKIDQAATFSTMVFLECTPKVKFGSQTDQECTKDGVPKWDVQVTVATRQFGKNVFTTLKISVIAEIDPGEGIAPFTPVHAPGLELGVMDKTSKDGTVIGHTVFHRADGVLPIESFVNTGRGKNAEVA
jgi:hypothetical protein